MVEKELKVLKVDGLIVTLPMEKVVINLVVDKKVKKEVNIRLVDLHLELVKNINQLKVSLGVRKPRKNLYLKS